MVAESETERENGKAMSYMDCHIHTLLSPCACEDMSVRDILARATERGIRQVVLLDHFWGGRIEEWQIPSSLADEKKRWEDEFPDLDIFISGEFNYDEGLAASEMANKVDFVTAGVHTLKRYGIFIAPNVSVGRLSMIINHFELTPILDYFMEQTAAMLDCPDVLIAAHPFNIYIYLESLGYRCFEHLTETVEQVCPHFNGKGFEINEAIFKRVEKSLKERSPDRFQQAFDAYVSAVAATAGHVEFFTLASDAHDIDEIGKLSWSRRIVEEAGIESKLVPPSSFANRNGSRPRH